MVMTRNEWDFAIYHQNALSHAIATALNDERRIAALEWEHKDHRKRITSLEERTSRMSWTMKILLAIVANLGLIALNVNADMAAKLIVPLFKAL